jgi:hypothetical protein
MAEPGQARGSFDGRHHREEQRRITPTVQRLRAQLGVLRNCNGIVQLLVKRFWVKGAKLGDLGLKLNGLNTGLGDGLRHFSWG